MKYVIGHKNPDTDSIVSAIAYAYYLGEKGEKVIPGRQGELNAETKYVLDYFGVEEPELVEYSEEDKYYLVDHNSRGESIDGLKDEQILGVIDHHKISLKTTIPIYYHAEPIGSTSTIIAKILFNDGIKIPRHIAGILLAGILSDTVVFKSVTTTDEDISIAKKLAEIAGVEIDKFGIEMKKKLADVSDLSGEEIVNRDLKIFETDKIKFAIGQVEQVDWDILSRKDELLNAMKKIKERGFEFVALMITNIIEGDTRLLYVGNDEVLRRAFGEPKDSEFYLKGVMSRKKQVVPKILEAI